MKNTRICPKCGSADIKRIRTTIEKFRETI